MTTVSVTQLNANDEITAAGANLPHNQLAAVINGNLDDNNISSLSGTKITTGTLPTTALDSTVKSGWLPITGSISAVTYNGNRSYSLTTSSDNSGAISPGMRLRTTRTVSAPTQVASLNGTNNYFSKTSPAGMTFTDDFTVSAWVKLNSYTGAIQTIASRWNGTSGWQFKLETSGQVTLQGNNGGAGNYSIVTSYQSLPLNKWVHVTAQLDMSSFTASTTTSYVMLDGVDVPCSVSRAGTNPTALVQAGDLQIGAGNSVLFFNGKIAQVAIFNAKVTQATIRGYISQGLSGSETSLISAYSFNNSITDLNTTNANNLTNNNSTSITNADSPFGGQADGTISATKDYCIVQTASASTLVVQVPEGCTIPTSGGVSACSYSSFKNPYGFPGQRGKFLVQAQYKVDSSTTSNANYGPFQSGGFALTVPIGSFDVGYGGILYNTTTTRVGFSLSPSSLTGVAELAESSIDYTTRVQSPSAAVYFINAYVKRPQELSSALTYVMYTVGATTGAGIGGTGTFTIFAENAYL